MDAAGPRGGEGETPSLLVVPRGREGGVPSLRLVPFSRRRHRMNTAARICVACLALAHIPLSAQDPPSNDDRLARVVAVVGDSAITDIDLQEQLAAWRAQARRDPPPPGPELDALLRELLDGRVTELLLLQAATRDTTLAILDSEVAGAVDNHIARLRQQFGGQAGLDRALTEQGQTPTSYRDGLMVQARRDQIGRAHV